MAKRRFSLSADAPLIHTDHPRPVTRRDFLGYGMASGLGSVLGGSFLSLFANPRQAHAAMTNDLAELKKSCSNINLAGAGKIPFICFDLAGGASIVGSNVLGGKSGGQLDFVSTMGYSRQGLPGDMVPSADEQQFINKDLGLAFHSDSGFLRGIQARAPQTTTANINGALIPARSDNDTGNNPHNPMYAINKAGANGELLALIGSQATDSGGNSISPASLINPEVRPTKISQPSDVSGLIDTGKLVGLLKQEDAVAVMEAVYRLSKNKLDVVTADATIKELMNCGYLKSADIVDRYGDPTDFKVDDDPDIVGPTGIFSLDDWNGPDGREFKKTASVMKLVLQGHAGAGTISMGGFDYHTGNRAVGEIRDFRAGQCMGACLEYAARLKQPLMLYVFSDGSVFSNGETDDSIEGRGKGVWTGDSSASSAGFFLLYDPDGRPESKNNDPTTGIQIGYFRQDGSIETSASPAANNVNLLVNTVALNYMALHGEAELNRFNSEFLNNSLGSIDQQRALAVFEPLQRYRV